MRWFRNLRTTVSPGRTSSGFLRGGVKSKNLTAPAVVGGGTTFLRFNSATNSQYLGLRSIGGM